MIDASNLVSAGVRDRKFDEEEQRESPGASISGNEECCTEVRLIEQDAYRTRRSNLAFERGKPNAAE